MDHEDDGTLWCLCSLKKPCAFSSVVLSVVSVSDCSRSRRGGRSFRRSRWLGSAGYRTKRSGRVQRSPLVYIGSCRVSMVCNTAVDAPAPASCRSTSSSLSSKPNPCTPSPRPPWPSSPAQMAPFVCSVGGTGKMVRLKGWYLLTLGRAFESGFAETH